MTLATLDYPGAKIVMDADTEPEQQYRVRACGKEPWTVRFIEEIPSGSPEVAFYDIGANVGSYALIAAARNVLTVAVEPGFANYTALCRNAMRNQLMERIIAMPVALARVRQLLWFDYQDVRPGAASHVLGARDRMFFQRQLVMAWPLDDLVGAFELPWPTHLKIDVDGGEGAVLEGADGVLRDPRTQALMLEMPLESEQGLGGYLAERGWRLRERFGERDGHPIANICYGWFVR